MDFGRRNYLTTMGATVCSLVLAGCSSDAPTAEKNVKLLHHEMVREDGGLAVKGEAKNVAGTEIAYAEIVVEWLEGEAYVNSSVDFYMRWPAGEIWAFDIGYAKDRSRHGLVDTVTNYRIRVDRVSKA